MRSDLVRLTLLGSLTGLLAGLVVLSFRWVIEQGQRGFLPEGALGNYEALPWWGILALPLLSGLLLGLLFNRLPESLRKVGIVHVVHQMRHTGRPDLPWSNALVQFFAGAFAIIGGHSIDREGPSVHLGAAAGTQVGIRSTDMDTFTLTACGAAAAIAAAFNTPLTGVVFVIEVLGVRYRVDRFIPIITASVVAAILSQAVYGATPSFSIAPDLAMVSRYELFLLLLLGLATGLLAAVFIGLTEHSGRLAQNWKPSTAFTLAGLLTGLIGLAYPQILGVSYDTLSHILNSPMALLTLFGLMLGKLVATAVSVGFRLPGGLIGPSLIIGGALGQIMGVSVQGLFGFDTSPVGFYAIVGMLAMMSAVLRAPLAALLALLELTANLNVLFPGMIVVVGADIVARQLLGKESIFEHLRRLTAPKENTEED
ncbi:MAG: chloride channel protein [gamma proteobacterium symbiont of Bathyaustriella thionipta]|nr:chloride channel protein [gamma proteobacterium symbiont of Bathyaustriella thionipta]